MAAVVMHHFSVLAAPSVRSQGTVLGGVFRILILRKTIDTIKLLTLSLILAGTDYGAFTLCTGFFSLAIRIGLL